MLPTGDKVPTAIAQSGRRYFLNPLGPERAAFTTSVRVIRNQPEVKLGKYKPSIRAESMSIVVTGEGDRDEAVSSSGRSLRLRRNKDDHASMA